VGLQEPVTRKSYLLVANCSQPSLLIATPNFLPLLDNVDAKFLLEVTPIEPPLFKLKNHFSHEGLMRRDRQRPKDGKLARSVLSLLQASDVVTPLRFVLVMHPRHMPEAGDA